MGILEVIRGCERSQARACEGNIEEKNNGYVVFKLNIHGREIGCGMRGSVFPPTHTPFYSRFLDRYLKTT
jgi:hypothetical protein